MLKKILILMSLTLSLSANAAYVEFEGVGYDVTAIDGTFEEVKSILVNSPIYGGGNLGQQISRVLATEYDGTTDWRFVYDVSNATETIQIAHSAYCNPSTCYSESFYSHTMWVGEEYERTWATVTLAGPSPVPIPAAAWLFGSALLGLGAIKRRRS
ncbi:MAG: VPLPA-CTERM sorting domain-containing protein [Halioglobus sp.]